MTEDRGRIGLVITTLGRIGLLENLMLSLRGQLLDGDAVVVVAQGNTAEVAELAARYSDLPIVVGTSGRGAALGRNFGVGLLPPGDCVMLFPNDSTWYPPGSVSAIRNLGDRWGFRIAGITVFDENGPKSSLPAEGTTLDCVNVWRVLEVGLVIRRSQFETLGGFDAMIGSGAPTPWQSGEVTDLLLRALIQWPELASEFIWGGDIAVGGIQEGYGLGKSERRRKLRAYGRGLGLLARRYHYSSAWRMKRLLGGAAVGLLRHREYGAVDGLWAFTGRLEGMLGRTFGKGPQGAVSK